MTLKRYDAAAGQFEQAEYRGQMPAFRYNAATSTWLDAYLTQGLEGYWSFESVHINSTTVTDASGSGRDGTLNGGVTTGSAGVVGDAVDFDGTDDYLEATDTADNLASVSLSAWVNPDTLPSNTSPSGHKGSESVIIGELGSANDILGLTIATGGTAFYIDTGTEYTTAGSAVPTGSWTHVAAVYDGSYQRVYINGVEDANATASGSLSSSTNTLKVGGGHSASDTWLDGRMDEPRVYSRGLSTSEVQALYAQGRPV